MNASCSETPLPLLSLQLPFELEIYYIQHVMLYVVPIYLLWKGGKASEPHLCAPATPRLSLLFGGIAVCWVLTRILGSCLAGCLQDALCHIPRGGEMGTDKAYEDSGGLFRTILCG